MEDDTFEQVTNNKFKRKRNRKQRTFCHLCGSTEYAKNVIEEDHEYCCKSLNGMHICMHNYLNK